MLVVPIHRPAASWSVVSVGCVQVRVTLSPLRLACRSRTGSGRCSEGGCGAPGVPQPARDARDNIPISLRMKTNQTNTRDKLRKTVPHICAPFADVGV